MTLTRILLRGALPLFGLACVCARTSAAPQSARAQISGDIPAAVGTARPLGRVSGNAPVALTLTLPLRDQDALEDLLVRLHDPSDPAYGHYLSPAQFAARFSPTEADYAALADFARAQGLTVTRTHPNRLLLDVSGPAGAVESAFHVRLNQYQAADGRVFRAPDAAPSVPPILADRVTGVAGLSDTPARHPHNVRLSTASVRRPEAAGRGMVGTGPGGGLAPQDIKAAYNLGGTSLNGSGQTLALFELDGYNATDISAYESQFDLPSVPLQNVLVDGAPGVAGPDADEVTLDIELQIALAPGASRIMVYETGGTDSETLDGYSRIAEDDLAKQISTSWGLDEPDSDPSTLQAENAIFQQMGAQGQTIYAAAGDNGAYDTGSRRNGLSVDDPASQPYVCGVGGTTLTTSGAGGAYLSETTWNSGSVAGGAGGGGISTVWPVPAWQQSAVSSASRGSTAMRNVPDVSLNADPNTGYAIYVQGEWAIYGGTSCAAPLWSAFTALVNQQRAMSGQAPLGQAAPALYPLLTGVRYAADFHDIKDGSTNLYYPAITGYDEATGLGTFSGANLLTDLAPSAATTITAHTHLLWNNPDGRVMLWSVAPDGSHTENTFGPYTDGSPGTPWQAAALATGPDGKSHILWTNPDGRVILWTVDDAGNFTYQVYGPYTDGSPGTPWSAKALSVGADNLVHILWTNPDGRVILWNVDPAFNFTDAAFGPYTDGSPSTPWSATAIATGPDDVTRLVWNNPDGRVILWDVDNGFNFSYQVYGPYTDGSPSTPWSAAAVSVGPDGMTHILWTNPDSRVILWNVDAAFSFTDAIFDPYTDGSAGTPWSATALATGPDNLSRILWANPDNKVILWNISSAFGFTEAVYGPYTDGSPSTFWSATAVSSGP